jgi:5-methylcytosine-specific restriction endonuclease McrA
MGNLARQYTRPTLKRLYGLSGNKCANPKCDNSLLGFDEKTMVDEIVHITAASPQGQRYDSNMKDEDRRDFDNLILLCQSCHKVVDNPSNQAIYTVEVLKEWKKIHEDKQKMNRLNDTSLLKIAVKAISDAHVEEVKNNAEDEHLEPVNPANKIQYNDIKRNKSLINDYKIYYSKINSIYNELEEQGSFRKEKLLRNIRALYQKIKSKYILDSTNGIEIIRRNADNIFDEVEEELFTLLNDKMKDNYFEVTIIMVDAFIRCKILEEPPKK